MPKFGVDLSKTREFKLIEEGKYVAVVRTAKVGTSQSGNPKLSVMLEIAEALQDTTEDMIGQNQFDDLVLDGKGAFKVGQFIEAITGEKPGPDDEFDTDDLIDEEVIIEVFHDVWPASEGGDDKTRSKVSKYHPANDGIY